MNFTDLSFLLIPEVAMEADDITKQVNQIMGGKNAPAETKTDDQREEDLTQTDGIFNDINKDDAENDPVDTPQNDDPDTTQDNNPNDSATDQGDNPDDAMDPNNPDEGMDDQNMDDQNMDQDPMAGDQQTPEDEGMSEENKSIFSDKNTLKENMIYFFNIMRYTITSLEYGLGTTEDQETIRVINSVIHNLYNSKDILYKIITEEIESSPYETLVTKYITLKRIYDISCDMLEEHFSNNPNSRVKYKRFKKKSK